MNNYFPYDPEEWETIVENAFSSDAPEHTFSDAYEQKKKKLLTFATERRFTMKRTMTILLTAAACAAILVPSVAVGASQIYQAWQTRTDPHRNAIQIDARTNTSDQVMALSYGWLPEELTCSEDGKYRSETSDMAMTPLFWKLPSDTMTLSTMTEYVTGQETYTTKSGNTVMYVQRDAGYDEMWVAFTDTLYVAQLYVNGMSEEETRQIAEHLTLVPAETETASIWDDAKMNAEGVEITIPLQFEPENLNLCNVGDTVALSGMDGDFSVTINRAALQDDFTGIKTDCIGLDADYRGYLDENGKITAKRSLIHYGDGINSLDEVISEETTTMQVLVLELTYTNEGAESAGVGIFAPLFQLEDNHIVDMRVKDWDEGIEYNWETAGELMADNSFFSFATQHGHEKNGIYDLAPGESATVQLAYLVDEDWLGNLYLDLVNPSGYPAESIDAGCPILDLSDLTE